MTRGKYAAKAKNRMANLDNELLQDVIAERDELKRRLSEACTKAEVAERALSSQVLAMSEKRAAGIVADVQAKADAEIQDLQGELIAERFTLGLWVATWIKKLEKANGDAAIIPNTLFSFLCHCSPTGTVAPYDEFLPRPAGGVSAREWRRRTEAGHRYVSSLYAQVHNTANPPHGFGSGWTGDIPNWRTRLRKVLSEARGVEEA